MQSVKSEAPDAAEATPAAPADAPFDLMRSFFRTPPSILLLTLPTAVLRSVDRARKKVVRRLAQPDGLVEGATADSPAAPRPAPTDAAVASNPAFWPALNRNGVAYPHTLGCFLFPSDDAQTDPAKRAPVTDQLVAQAQQLVREKVLEVEVAAKLKVERKPPGKRAAAAGKAPPAAPATPDVKAEVKAEATPGRVSDDAAATAVAVENAQGLKAEPDAACSREPSVAQPVNVETPAVDDDDVPLALQFAVNAVAPLMNLTSAAAAAPAGKKKRKAATAEAAKPAPKSRAKKS
jgi:hypothetical protein